MSTVMSSRCGCTITLKPGETIHSWGPCVHGTWFRALERKPAPPEGAIALAGEQ